MVVCTAYSKTSCRWPTCFRPSQASTRFRSPIRPRPRRSAWLSRRTARSRRRWRLVSRGISSHRSTRRMPPSGVSPILRSFSNRGRRARLALARVLVTDEALEWERGAPMALPHVLIPLARSPRRASDLALLLRSGGAVRGSPRADATVDEPVDPLAAFAVRLDHARLAASAPAGFLVRRAPADRGARECQRHRDHRPGPERDRLLWGDHQRRHQRGKELSA